MEVFGFTNPVAKALYDEQLLQDKKTLAKLSDSKINRQHHAYDSPDPSHCQNIYGTA